MISYSSSTNKIHFNENVRYICAMGNGMFSLILFYHDTGIFYHPSILDVLFDIK